MSGVSTRFGTPTAALSPNRRIVPPRTPRFPSPRTERITLLLVRHGARYDYANKEAWAARCKAVGAEHSDPPLSALGHLQARETATALAREAPDCILSSPYLRVLQTAQPLAHAIGLPIRVEHCLAEFGHSPQRIPAAAARVPILPEVDEDYEPLLDRACRGIDPITGKEPTTEYLRRLLLFREELRHSRWYGKTIVCFSHAASVALVGALTGCATLVEAGCFAPCGIWKLISDDGGATWTVQTSGASNPHVSANDPTTFPWGFEHSGALRAHEAAWLEALARGPTERGAVHSPPGVVRSPSRFGPIPDGLPPLELQAASAASGGAPPTPPTSSHAPSASSLTRTVSASAAAVGVVLAAAGLAAAIEAAQRSLGVS